MIGNMQKYLAEFVETLALILIGCSTIAIAGFAPALGAISMPWGW